MMADMDDHSVQQFQRQRQRLRRRCLMLCGGLVGVTLLLCLSLIYFFEYPLHKVHQQYAQRTVDQVETYVRARLIGLRQIAHFYNQIEQPTEEAFQGFSRSLMNDIPGFEAVLITDTQGHPRWIASEQGLTMHEVYRMVADPKLDFALERALQLHQPSITEPLYIPNLDTGFLAATPIVYGQRHIGYVVGIFCYQRLLESLLRSECAGECSITLQQAGQTLFYGRSGYGPHRMRWLEPAVSMPKTFRSTVWLGGQPWRLDVTPVLEADTAPLMFAVLTILVMGLLLSVLISYLLFRWQWHSVQLQHQALENRNRLAVTGRSLEDLKAELDLVLNNVGEAVILYDENLDPIHANPAFLDYFGIADNSPACRERQAHHERLIDLIGSETKYWAPFNSLKHHPEQSYFDEFEIQTRDANDKHLCRTYRRRAMALCGSETTSTGWLLIYQDVTTLKDLEHAKDDFLSNVTHELRSPLASIKGFAEMLRRDESMQPETRNEFIDIICQESSRLQNLIEELLDLRRMERHNASFHPVRLDLKVLVEDVLQGARSILISKEVAARTEWDGLFSARIWGDAPQLRRALHNLLVNAAKYSRRGGEILVRGYTGHTRVCLEFSDRGSGIADQDLPHIFDRFYRGSSRGQQKGTGLGLALVKHIVENHGGHLGVRSEVGRGTTFRLEFPRLASKVHPRPQAGAAHGGLAPEPQTEGNPAGVASQKNPGGHLEQAGKD